MNEVIYPAYSVLMSVYRKDSADALQQAIDSMLCQTIPTDDFVIVCDGPLTAELDKVLDRSMADNPEIKVHRLAMNGGLGHALAVGLPLCKNELIARMDSDDISDECRCERELKAFAEDDSLDIVSGTILEFDQDPSDGTSFRKLPADQESILRFAHRRNPVNHVTVMYRKASVLAAGNYQSFDRVEDYYLWVRMFLNGCRAKNLDDVLVYVRVGNGMQARRQGWDYIKSQLAFQSYLRGSGFISTGEYARNCLERFAAALMPASARSFMYDKLLRSREGK